MNDPSLTDIDAPETLEQLRAEVARLRRALAEAGVDALDAAELRREREVEHGTELATSRRDTAEARATTRLVRADLTASELQVSDLQTVRD